MNTKISKPPELWDYVEATSYLRDFYTYLKTQDRGFSYATWAQSMGIKSRSFLRLLLVNKRNLTEDTADMFSQYLKHSTLEKQYFLALVRLARASSLNEKEIQTTELAKLRQKFALKNHNLVEIQKADLLEFLISYKMPRLQTLLDIKGIQKTIPTLSEILEMKPTEVESMLQILKKLGLAETTENSEWRSKKSQLMAPDALGNVAVQSFHKKSLEVAIKALDLPTDTRSFKSLIMNLTETQYQELNEKITDFLKSTLKENSNSNLNDPQRIYQLNINLIPVTGPIRPDFTQGEPMANTEIQKEVENENH